MRILSRLKNAPRRLRRILGLPYDFESQIYHALVEKGDIIYDIGANIGDMSILLSRLAGSSGTVVAFEPVQPPYEELCRRIRRRPARCAPITAIPCGLSDSPGTRLIQVPHSCYALGSLASSNTWAETLQIPDMASFECRFETLDAMAVKGLARPHFMKIDVEGAELFVLKGASMLLHGERPPLMLIEIFAPWERAFSYDPSAVFSLLARKGYEFLFACPAGLVAHRPSVAEPFPPEYKDGYNVVAFIPVLHAKRIGRLEPLRKGQNGRILSMAAPPQPNIIV